MVIEFTIKQSGDKVIISVSGELDSEEKSNELKDMLSSIYEQGEREIVLDLDDTSFIDSEGIGKILMFYKRLKDHDGCLYITPPNDTLREMLETLRLDKVIEIYTGQEA